MRFILKPLAFVAFAIVAVAPAKAEDVKNVSFGELSIKLPHPTDLCEVKRSTPLEERFLIWQSSIQRELGNKLLSLWIDCPSHKALIAGNPPEVLDNWIIAVATLAADGTESVYESYKFEDLKRETIALYSDDGLEQFYQNEEEFIDTAIAEANDKYLRRPDAVSVGAPQSLGILGITEFIHAGVIMSVEASFGMKRVAGLISSSVLSGAIVHVYNYRVFEDQNTIRNLLSASRDYTSKLYSLN